MIIALKFVVSCDVLSLTKSFQSSCFGHAFSKAFEYALIDEKIYKGLKYVSIKTPQFDLHKCIIWLKNEGKVEKNGTGLCDSNFPQKKININIKTKLSSKF